MKVGRQRTTVGSGEIKPGSDRKLEEVCKISQKTTEKGELSRDRAKYGRLSV